MKITDQQLCIVGLFILATGALVCSSFMGESNQGTLVTITASVVSGILGYLKGKE
jgi:hypothetical protein